MIREHRTGSVMARRVAEAHRNEIVPGDALEEEKMLGVHLTHFSCHTVVERLQSETVSDRGNQLPGGCPDIPSEGLVYEFIADHIRIVLKHASHLHPEGVVNISSGVFVIIERLISSSRRNTELPNAPVKLRAAILGRHARRVVTRVSEFQREWEIEDT